MSASRLAAGAIALALACLASPAFADNDKTPPGDPCGSGPGQGTGNPCNGNEGNDGANGNSGHKPAKPVVVEMSMPSVHGRAAFIEQVGDANSATIAQSASNAYAHVRQDGRRNEIDVRQQGNATSYLEAAQSGARNRAAVTQGGNGQNLLYLSQTGSWNQANAIQTASSGMFNGAVMSQSGDGNIMNLEQDGSDNRALLTQKGDGNAMTAAQEGSGNRLVWSQVGNNLSNLSITQTGSTSMLITQTKGK